MSQQRHNSKSESVYCGDDRQQDDGYDNYDDDYDSNGDYSLHQARAGGGGDGRDAQSKKSAKRHNKRGGGCVNVYSSKHIRAMEAQRIQRK